MQHKLLSLALRALVPPYPLDPVSCYTPACDLHLASSSTIQSLSEHLYDVTLLSFLKPFLKTYIFHETFGITPDS